MREISVKTKLKEGRGKGEGAFYKPWVTEADFNSKGTCSSFTDWKHKRAIQLLSLSELYIYIKYRFMSDVADIREQYPLYMTKEDEEKDKDKEEKNKDKKEKEEDEKKRYTIEIATEHGFKHPQVAGDPVPLTTDLLIVKTDGSMMAVSCKYSKESLKKPSAKHEKEKLIIEKEYWESRGVEWQLDYPKEEDRTIAHNLMSAVLCFDKETVKDDVSLLKHLVATKKIVLDLTKPIMWVRLAKEMRDNGELDKFSDNT